MDRQYYLKDSEPFKDFFREHDYAVMHAIQPNNGKHRHPEYFELGYMISGTAVHTLNYFRAHHKTKKLYQKEHPESVIA